jgi:alpha-tubulin suppressor-like RCC1 family protein
VLTKTGDIVVFGSLRYGQCGVGIQGRISVPTILRQPQNTVFTKIWAKVDSTFMLSSDGHLFACGRGFEGNFGNGKLIEAENQASINSITDFDNLECKNYLTPHMLDEFLPFQPADIEDIVIGGYCTFIILKDKRTIYSAGGNRYGQTLQNSLLPSIKRFKKIELEAGFVNHIQKQSTQSLEFKIAAGELYSILYFRDPEKKGNVMQWFGVNYDANTKSIFSGFYDVTIICCEDNAEDGRSVTQQKLDLEPLKKKKKFV